MSDYKIILASGSPRRRELMNLVGAEYIIISSDKEEDMSGHVPSEMVKGLSKMKAMDVYGKALSKISTGEIGEEYKKSVIIGCDTVVAYGRKILGKPHTSKEAFDMIRDFQGRSHEVYTGVCLLIMENGIISELVNYYIATTVNVSPMTDEEISAYVATGECMDKAGAYAIQGLFAPYIEGIEGDYYNIVGFPINSIYHELRKRDISLF